MSKLYRFVKHPEFLKEGQRLVFREGRTKAVGNVCKIIPYIPATVGKDQKSKSHQVWRQSIQFFREHFHLQVRGDGKKRTTGSANQMGQLQQPAPAQA